MHLGILDTDGFSSATLMSGLNDADASFNVDDITTVVPEPSTAILFGLGLAALGGRRRRG